MNDFSQDARPFTAAVSKLGKAFTSGTSYQLLPLGHSRVHSYALAERTKVF